MEWYNLFGIFSSLLQFSNRNSHRSSSSIRALMSASNDWSPENMTLMVPVRNEKKVRPMNSTHIEKRYSMVVSPVISP